MKEQTEDGFVLSLVNMYRWGEKVIVVQKRGTTVYYDGVSDRAFQEEDGDYISATAYGAFGDDAGNAQIAYKNWLKRAKAAWEELTEGDVSNVKEAVEQEYEEEKKAREERREKWRKQNPERYPIRRR